MEWLMIVKIVSLLGVFKFTFTVTVHVFRGFEISRRQAYPMYIAWVVFIWSMGWLN